MKYEIYNLNWLKKSTISDFNLEDEFNKEFGAVLQDQLKNIKDNNLEFPVDNPITVDIKSYVLHLEEVKQPDNKSEKQYSK